jgi:hypothetical protein
MSDNMRYKYGDTNPISLPFKPGVVIELGDLCYTDDADGGTVKPASSFTWSTDLPTTQPLFHLQFAGVAMQSYDGDTVVFDYGLKDGKIRLATTGVFDFDCASATFLGAAFVGPAKATGNNLENQKVAAVATELLSVGRVQDPGTSLTVVRVRIRAAKTNINA